MSAPKLPADVDRLLWEVAESQDPKAFDDFQVRFPHLVLELGQRIKLVRELRGARSDSVTSVRAPHFEYRKPSPAPISRFTWVGAALALTALGFGAFLVTKQLNPAPRTSQAITQLPPPVQSVAPVAPNSALANPQSAPPSTLVDNGPGSNSTYKGPRWQQNQDVKFAREHLQTVLAAVAYQGGLNIVFAPDTPNPTIAMEYHGMNSVEIIQDLGRKFGFSAMKNGPTDVLIVPARDPNAKDTPVSGQGMATNLDSDSSTASAPATTDSSTKDAEPTGKPSKRAPASTDTPSTRSRE
jgi:hypothetical protein